MARILFLIIKFIIVNRFARRMAGRLIARSVGRRLM